MAEKTRVRDVGGHSARLPLLVDDPVRRVEPALHSAVPQRPGHYYGSEPEDTPRVTFKRQAIAIKPGRDEYGPVDVSRSVVYRAARREPPDDRDPLRRAVGEVGFKPRELGPPYDDGEAVPPDPSGHSLQLPKDCLLEGEVRIRVGCAHAEKPPFHRHPTERAV